MTNITVKNHGTVCSELGKTGIAKTKKGKYEPVICKKSRQIFGRKYKSTLKKKKGTLSFGKYGKKLAHPNNNNQNSECMNKPCWHRFSLKNKNTKKNNYIKEKEKAKQYQLSNPPPENNGNNKLVKRFKKKSKKI